MRLRVTLSLSLSLSLCVCVCVVGCFSQFAEMSIPPPPTRKTASVDALPGVADFKEGRATVSAEQACIQGSSFSIAPRCGRITSPSPPSSPQPSSCAWRRSSAAARPRRRRRLERQRLPRRPRRRWMRRSRASALIKAHAEKAHRRGLSQTHEARVRSKQEGHVSTPEKNAV